MTTASVGEFVLCRAGVCPGFTYGNLYQWNKECWKFRK